MAIKYDQEDVRWARDLGRMVKESLTIVFLFGLHFGIDKFVEATHQSETWWAKIVLTALIICNVANIVIGSVFESLIFIQRKYRAFRLAITEDTIDNIEPKAKPGASGLSDPPEPHELPEPSDSLELRNQPEPPPGD
jgi:hypothetical protein